ncbi:MAG TPA: Hsp20/alpha crystallin family protein [Candidatus Paceibacterota bacterium]|nr:Hsp20/alpha crystallin family protein [Candidatus Paceibacterota bacterium]
MKKRSLFDRLAGTRSEDDYDFDDDMMEAGGGKHLNVSSGMSAPHPAHEERTEGHLPVDMYQTGSEIIIRTFVAGVRPDEMNVSISRDMVVVEGSREERSEATGPDYFNQELFWGTFARTIMLPQEIDVDGAQASSKDGLLTIILPKLDKTRQTKLKVRSS